MLSQESIILLSLLLRAIVILVFCPQPPSSLDAVLVSICASLHWGSQCDGAWCVPLSGLSWLPSKIACGPLPLLQAPSPHPPIVDGFNVLLAWENSQHFTMPPLVSPQNDVWCQCRNSMLMMCRHYPDLGTSDTSPVENLLHPIRVVISHQWGISALIPQTSFCGNLLVTSQNVDFFLRLLCQMVGVWICLNSFWEIMAVGTLGKIAALVFENPVKKFVRTQPG